jgi:hypothetical protein
MSETNAQARPWPSLTFFYVVAIAHLVIFGVFGFSGVSTLRLLAMPDPKPPNPAPALVDPTPSRLTFSAPELPYTFVVPNGFLPSMKADRDDDARLLPEPWLPTSINIKLSRHDLEHDVSTMNAAELRQYARKAIRGWPFGEPTDTIMTADGSTGLQYPQKSNIWYVPPGSLYTVVFHRRTAVLVDTNATQECSDAQRKALREATRTIVRTMKFRD